MRRPLLVVCSIVVTLALAVPAEAGVVSAHVAIEDFQFLPSTKTFNQGSSGYAISFDNGGSFAHTATSDSGMFDTDQIAPASNGVISIYGAGTYPFHCVNHDFMTGTIVARPVPSDGTVTVGATIVLRVGAEALKGASFDVQRRFGKGLWKTVRAATSDPSPTFSFSKAGTYSFRARTYAFGGGPHSAWSTPRKVLVSPA
jgi:plastocyanin